MKLRYLPHYAWGWLLCSLAGASMAHAQQVAAPILGEAATYGLLSATSISVGEAKHPTPVQVLGQAGAQQTIDPGVRATAGVHAHSTGTVARALADADKARGYCTELGGTSLNAQLDKQQLTGGVYRIAGDARLSRGAALRLTGDNATVIVLNVTGSLYLDEQARVVLDGVLPGHVFWNVAGEVQLLTGTHPAGVVLAQRAILANGPLTGRCTLFSNRAITLANLSATVGHNQFFAPDSRGYTASKSQTVGDCTFTAPDGELVQDGSLELANSLPYNFSGLSVPSDACYWISGTDGTCDYFYNGGDPDVSVPTNAFSIRTSRQGSVTGQVPALGQNTTLQNGEAYGGAYASANNNTWFEYVTQENQNKLYAGHRYYAEFSARLAPASTKRAQYFGLALAPAGWLTSPAHQSIGNSPVVPSQGSGIEEVVPGALSNTSLAVWQRLGQVYTPTSDWYGFTLLVGNFRPNQQLSNGLSLAVPDGSAVAAGAYYYVDNVTLSMVTEAGQGVTLGPACLGGNGNTSITLGTLPMPAMVGATYSWTASPADPSLVANVANPTVTPMQPTTYTLTVSLPVPQPVFSAQGQQQLQTQTYSSSVTVNRVGPSYSVGPGSTYGTYDLGVPNTTTTYSAGGGTVVFNGHYHVRGNVRFTSGTFQLQPGTVFYVDNTFNIASPTFAITVDNATLQLTGATLQANDCSTWSGVELTNGGVIRTDAYSYMGNVQRSVIRDMYVGVRSSAGNRYYLNNTDFVHNNISFLDLVGFKVAQAGEGITNCTFTDGSNGINLMQSYRTDSNPLFDGDYNLAQFQNNTFRNLTYAFGSSGGRVHVSGNTFYDCGLAALEVSHRPGNAGPPDVQYNTVYVPAAGSWQQQGYPGPYGITVSGQGISVTQNTVVGYPQAAGAQPARSGILLEPVSYGAAAQANPVTNNTILYLEEGITGYTDEYSGNTFTITGNTLDNNAAGVALYPLSYQPGVAPAPVSLTLKCNSFDLNTSNRYSASIGLWVKNNAVITDGLGVAGVPNGNSFVGFASYGPSPAQRQYAVVNDNTAWPIAYTPYKSQYESFVLNPGGSTANTISDFSNSNVTGSVLTYAYLPANGANACPNGIGVQNQRALPPTWPAFAAQLDSLRRPDLPARQQQLAKALLARPVQDSELATLEAYLADEQAPAWQEAALRLLQAYRQRNDQGHAASLRARLLAHAPANAELAAYLRLGEATDRLGNLLPGLYPLDATTRALLTQVAASGTTPAPVACQLLHAYDPSYQCAGQPAPAAAPGPLAARAAQPATQPLLLSEAHPNPASETVSFAYQLPTGSPAARLVLRDLTGRLVLAQATAAPAGELTVSVRELAAGLYVATLEANGQRLASHKLAVVH